MVFQVVYFIRFCFVLAGVYSKVFFVTLLIGFGPTHLLLLSPWSSHLYIVRSFWRQCCGLWNTWQNYRFFFFLIERSLTVTKVNVNALKISLHTCNKGLKFSDLLKPIKLLFIQSHTGLYYRKGFQQAEENYCFLLLCTCETTSEVLCPVWGSSVQERRGGTGVSPAESHRDG